MGKISYKLELAPHFKVHSICHSVLEPYHDNKDDPNQIQICWALVTITTLHDREIASIIDYQAKRKQGHKATAMFPIHLKRSIIRGNHVGAI